MCFANKFQVENGEMVDNTSFTSTGNSTSTSKGDNTSNSTGNSTGGYFSSTTSIHDNSDAHNSERGTYLNKFGGNGNVLVNFKFGGAN